MSRRLIRNAAKCNLCGDTIESRHVHDLRRCSCGALFVDGGLDYARRGFGKDEEWVDLSEYDGEEEPAQPAPVTADDSLAERMSDERMHAEDFDGGGITDEQARRGVQAFRNAVQAQPAPIGEQVLLAQLNDARRLFEGAELARAQLHAKLASLATEEHAALLGKVAGLLEPDDIADEVRALAKRLRDARP